MLPSVTVLGLRSRRSSSRARSAMAYRGSMLSDGIAAFASQSARWPGSCRRKGSVRREGGAECRKLLRLHGINASMSRKRNCLDNAPMESFSGSLKTELVLRTTFTKRRQSRTFRRHQDLPQSPTASFQHRPSNTSASKDRHHRGKRCIDQKRPGTGPESKVSAGSPRNGEPHPQGRWRKPTDVSAMTCDGIVV